MVERRVLILFFPMAFLLSWYPYILGKTHLVKTSGGINPLGPMVAALIVAAIFYGKAGVKELLGRYARWRDRPCRDRANRSRRAEHLEQRALDGTAPLRTGL